MKINSIKYISTCNQYLKKMDDSITPFVFNSTPENIKEIIREFSPHRIKELAQLNCFAANECRKYLDNLCDKKYTVISIGRSASCIVETMGFMEVDTKFIPISGLRNGLPKNKLDITPMRVFLESIGITKKNITQNTEKKFILMDYEYTGTTLDSIHTLLCRNDMLGDNSNLIKVPVNIALSKNYYEKEFNLLFSLNRFKNFSPVGKLTLDNLDNIFNQSTPNTVTVYKYNITKFLRKLFMFNVCDILHSGNYNNCTGEKELQALYNHHLTQKAMRIKLEQSIKNIKLNL